MTSRTSIPAKLWKLARSRRLGVVLTALVAVYIAMGTFIAQGPYEDPLVSAWAAAHPTGERVVAALGLHNTYNTPVFLLLVGLLVISTAACSVERTGSARRLIRRTRATDDATSAAARFRPRESFAVAKTASSEEALEAAAQGLRRLGMHVTRRDNLVEGFAGRWGAFGSPAFHWCLALLGLTLILGQATRAEGLFEMPMNTPIREAHVSYTRIVEGAFFGERHTGVLIEASDLVYNFGAGGVNRGPSPVVTLRDGSGVVAQQRVYPNSPLRYRALMVHMASYGVAPVVTIETSAGATIASKTTLLEFSRETSSGTVAQEFGVSGDSLGGTVPVRIEIVADRDAGGLLGRVPRSPRLVVSTMAAQDTTFSVPSSLKLGDAVLLPDGGRLRFVSAQNWVRLNIANDWSVSVIYLLSALACVGLFVALFVPMRGARIMVQDAGTGASLGVTTWHVRRDAAFREAVYAVAQDAASGLCPAKPVWWGWWPR